MANLTVVADFGEFGDKFLCSANFSFSKEFPYLKLRQSFVWKMCQHCQQKWQHNYFWHLGCQKWQLNIIISIMYKSFKRQYMRKYKKNLIWYMSVHNCKNMMFIHNYNWIIFLMSYKTVDKKGIFFGTCSIIQSGFLSLYNMKWSGCPSVPILQSTHLLEPLDFPDYSGLGLLPGVLPRWSHSLVGGTLGEAQNKHWVW